MSRENRFQELTEHLILMMGKDSKDIDNLQRIYESIFSFHIDIYLENNGTMEVLIASYVDPSTEERINLIIG